MDSENISDVNKEVAKPEEAVAAEAEGKLDEQQSSEEETELFIEEEGEQETPKEHGMTEPQVRAAQKQDRAKWKKERALKQDAEDRANKSDIEKAELLDRIAKLESGAEKASKGNRPSPLDYSSDEEFYSDLDKWNGKPAAASKATTEATPEPKLSDDQAYHLDKSERAIKNSFKDYGEVVSKAEEALKGAGVVNMNGAMNDIAQICHEIDIDPAKVKYALGRFPEEAAKLIQAVNTNPSARNTVLRKLEKKVQSRTKKKIDSEPEPKVKSNGAVNVGSEAEKKARQVWLDDPSLEN